MAKRKSKRVARSVPCEYPRPAAWKRPQNSTAQHNSFWEKYKHPKWQEKRLRIMDRDGFQCEQCGSKDSTLNVHHSYYESGLDPWEYPDESLHCLCDDCHRSFDNLRKDISRQIGRLELTQIKELFGFAKALELEACLDRNIVDGYVNSALSLMDEDRFVDFGILYNAATGFDELRRNPPAREECRGF